MWRKQDAPKPTSAAPDLVAPPGLERPRSIATPLGEAVSAAGNVSKGISVTGVISGREDLFIDGEVQGSIQISDGNVAIGPNGRVTADIEAGEIIVRGRVKGTLRGRERVQIGHTAEATGEVVTRRIVIEEGAIFRGKIEVVRAEEGRVPGDAGMTAGTDAFRPVPISVKDSQQ